MEDKATPFELGKLPADSLARLLEGYSFADPSVILGPKLGEDAAVMKMGDRYLVAKTDPITFATEAIGWYAVNINANDIACSGATPRWFLSTLLLPQDRADAALVEDIFAQIVRACEDIGATLVGGHTEITHGIDRPILVGAMLGEVEPEQLVTTGGARPGDSVLLTQGVAVEATSIIARERRDELSHEHGLSPGFLDGCADFIYRPGISVVRAAQVATSTAPIHAMHDPTEGGLATGLWELATAAGVGLDIDARTVPIYPETRLLCDLYGLDPWGAIASGSLLLTVVENDATAVCDALIDAGIAATVIGRVTDQERDVTMLVDEPEQTPVYGEPRKMVSKTIALPTFARDEITRLFE
jgi:hydrogenase maturation factor